MKAFSVIPNGNYNEAYYALFYKVFFENSIEEAYKKAYGYLKDVKKDGEITLEEICSNFYHKVNDKICGKLEPIKECSYSPGGWGIIYKCLSCGQETDDSCNDIIIL